MVTHGTCLLAPTPGLPSHQGSRRHGSVSQASLGECETPAVANQSSFIKSVSFISHLFAASLVPSPVPVGFRHH